MNLIIFLTLLIPTVLSSVEEFQQTYRFCRNIETVFDYYTCHFHEYKWEDFSVPDWKKLPTYPRSLIINKKGEIVAGNLPHLLWQDLKTASQQLDLSQYDIYYFCNLGLGHEGFRLVPIDGSEVMFFIITPNGASGFGYEQLVSEKQWFAVYTKEFLALEESYASRL